MVPFAGVPSGSTNDLQAQGAGGTHRVGGRSVGSAPPPPAGSGGASADMMEEDGVEEEEGEGEEGESNNFWSFGFGDIFQNF